MIFHSVLIQALLLRDNVDEVSYVNVDPKMYIEDDTQEEKIREREKLLDEEIVASQNRKTKREKLEENSNKLESKEETENNHKQDVSELKDTNIKAQLLTS